MNELWITTENTALLIRRTEFDQSDTFPKEEDVLLGGVDTANGYSLPWANLEGKKRELQLKRHIKTAQIELENYLIHKGALSAQLTFITPQNIPLHNEKAN